ncbi:MAG: hypothetical protein Q9173_003568 [Seirophora scorigena]
MHLLKTCIAASIALLPFASSVAVNLEKRASDVTVTLSSAGGSRVKASITNNAASAFKFLKTGTFLDSAPVDKATVFKNGAPVAFKGILARVQTTDLTEDAFATLAPGATLENTFELAAVTDLSEGGKFEVVSEGAVPLANAGSTELIPDAKLAFRSNTLKIDVDGAAAARVPAAIRGDLAKTVVSCAVTAQGTTLQNALSRAVTLSNNAANAAASGSAAKFQEYFKTTAASARNSVAARFRAVAAQAGSTTNGGTQYYCSDPYGYCSPK